MLSFPGRLSLGITSYLSPNFLFFFFVFSRAAPAHMEVSKVGVKSELQLPPYAGSQPWLRSTAQLTATQEP